MIKWVHWFMLWLRRQRKLNENKLADGMVHAMVQL
jgi:hypothetical protein